MKKYSFVLNIIKCNGCKTTIFDKIKSFNQISNINVDVERSLVEFKAPSSELADKVLISLEKLAYTQGTPTNIQTAKSYLSCMIDKVKN